MAKIRWGTELQVDTTKENRKRVLYRTGLQRPAWRAVDALIPWMTYDQIREVYGKLYGDSGHYDSNRDGIPDRWIFSEFGPMAVRYFRDRNDNPALDEGNPLSVSDGCIHVAPTSRDLLQDAGAFKRGTTFIVHRYDEHPPVVPKLSLQLPIPVEPPVPIRPTRLVPEKTFLDFVVVNAKGKALSGRRYKLELPDGQTETGRLGSDGRIERQNIDPGTARFSLLPEEAVPAEDEEVAAEAGEETADAAATADEPATETVPEDQIAFRLIDIKGAPIAGQAFNIKLADGSVKGVVTDADGRVALSPVPPGDCVVTIA